MAQNNSSSSNSGADSGAMPDADNAYQVLARKYRPQNFEDLIGQDAMVRTLSNAFATKRIAQAYMLTGVRGVGKTTTARILARALNYVREDADNGPTIDVKELGTHCDAIMNSRHMDVLEMDAASHTGVDNIRELIESARYKPVHARYKVYIIDEVHMLSKGAFNALLKTLEEPPPHVKFIFATTEVRKVPVTVLSRCQRFDLKRVNIEALAKHFGKIAKAENVSVDDGALALLARAAEGSVRDGLSLLDQAIALGADKVESADVRAMIGLADRAQIFDLLEQLLRGQITQALSILEEIHKNGAEGAQILADLADIVHIVTRIKAVGAEAGGHELPEQDVKRASSLAAELSMPILARAWQMLLKGLGEARAAPRALAAAEMVLIRIAYTADLPTPDDLIRQFTEEGQKPSAAPSPMSPAGNGGGVGAPPQQRAAGATGEGGSHAEPLKAQAPEKSLGAIRLESFEEVVAFVAEKRDMRLKLALEDHARLVSFRPGVIELQYAEGVPQGLAGELAKKLSDWTGMRWGVSFSNLEGQPTIRSVQEKENAEDLALVKTHKLVKDFLAEFPDAQIKVKKAKLERLADDALLPDDHNRDEDDE